MLLHHRLRKSVSGCPCWSMSLSKSRPRSKRARSWPRPTPTPRSPGEALRLGSGELTFAGGESRLGRPGRLVFAAELPESIEKEDGRKAEHDENLEQPVDRGHRATDDDPGNASKRNQPKHDGDQEHHGKQVASSHFAYARCRAISRTVSLHPLLFKRLVDCLTLFGGERDFLVFFAKLFVDESQGIVARWQALDLKLPIGTGNRVEGILHHVDVHLHPRVLVTLDGKKDFFARKTLTKRCGLRGLRFVPLAVVSRLGMDVVRGGVAVDDLEALAGHHAEHVRMVPAAALVESDGIFWDVKSVVAKAVLYIDEHIGQMAAARDDGFRGVSPLAGRVLAHVDLRGRGHRAVKVDSATDGGSRGEIDGRGSRSSGGSSRGLLWGFLLLPAADGEDESTRQGQAENCHPGFRFHF